MTRGRYKLFQVPELENSTDPKYSISITATNNSPERKEKEKEMITSYSWTEAYTGESMDTFVTRRHLVLFVTHFINFIIKNQPIHHLIKNWGVINDRLFPREVIDNLKNLGQLFPPLIIENQFQLHITTTKLLELLIL